MWIEESRGRVVSARKTKRYPCDLTDDEWDRIAPLTPRPGRRGRPREVFLWFATASSFPNMPLSIAISIVLPAHPMASRKELLKIPG